MSNSNGQAVASYGANLQVKDPDTGVFLNIGGVTDFNGPQTNRGEIDVTTLQSPAKEYVLDLKDYGTFTSTMQTRYGDPAQQILLANLDSTDALEFKLVLADDGYKNGPVTIVFNARVQSFPIQGSMGQVVTTSLSLRITGEVDFDFPVAQSKRIVWAPTVLSEASVNDGTVAGVVSVVLSGDTFTGTDGATMSGVTVTGVPTGLTAATQKINDNTFILSFEGSATTHTSGTEAEVTVVLGDAAFTTGPASAVYGTTGKITIKFN